jgi:GT2 family glycosyltransferase
MARNTGVAAATGGILAFIDPDCVPGKSWLRSLFDAMRHPAVAVALGVRRPTPDTGNNGMLGDYDTTRDEWALTSGEPTKYYGYTNNMGVTRAAWDRHGPFDNRSRGSDTIFVRRVIDGEGCAALAFVPAMVVSHLEMDGVATYMRKAFTYGRSMQSYRRVIAVQPLTMGDRLAVFRKTVHNKSYGFLRASTLAVLLTVGLWAWAIGRLSGHIIRK